MRNQLYIYIKFVDYVLYYIIVLLIMFYDI